ncbi:alpha-2-macroglobulin family protein [Bryobacter aggregatus]|uniref:alpha-2-macroglobulin family protein n=1 Tax=Bryobacter aggregatus TaxID=360054 RepID=UPI0006910DDF|nr:MG2 domain-containing protein [Bryobacter aggregatus]
MRRWLLFAALMVVVPVVAQEDGGTYFALTSNKTFAPGEKALIQMWAQGIKSLDFRLYRVEKAGDFLGQLSDAHSFGNRVAELPKEDTAIAKFLNWKCRLRSKSQLFVRAQFTPEARTSFRGRTETEAAPKVEPATKGTSYAAIPILNDRQLLKTWKETVSTKQRWDEQPVAVPVSEPGLYLVEATDGKLRAYTLLSVSGMAVLTKTQPGQAIARVVDRISGQALAGVDVEFRSQKQSHGVFKTDLGGFAKLSGADSTDVFVIASRGKDVAFDSLNVYNLQPDEGHRMTTYVYTDRPVYRPGHKVYFKAILRKPAAFGYDLPTMRAVTAEITDSEGKPVFRKEISVSEFGTVKGEYELPMTAGLGYYGLKFSSGSMESYGGFNVEEYKKPEYEVRIRTTKPRVVQGERVDATVQAKYFFGEPVKGAKVTYTVRRAPYYPPWYERDEDAERTVDEDESGGEGFSGEQGEEKTGKLNDQGELVISLPTPVAARDYLFRVEAKVMDEGNREVTGYGLVIATHGSYMASVTADKYVVEPGATASYTVTLKDYDSKPIVGDFRAELKRYAFKDGHRSDTVVETSSGRTAENGEAKLSFRVPEAGSYILTVTSRTPEGRDVKDEAWTWVSGYGGIYGGDEETIKLITDKKKYAPGDVAKILILTTAPDTDIWVTTECRTVIDSRAVKAASAGGVTIEVPVKSEYQPKVFVTASYLKAGKLYQGTATIKVPPIEKELSINVVPSKQEFKPGEPARYNVEVKDSKGQPARAELSLGVVDEALYAVQKDMTQTPLGYFYGNVYNEVNSSNSLSYYFRGEAGKRAMRLAKLRPSLGQLKPERVGDPRVRKAFPDTAFWTADLVTDASGKGKVEFAFPDALTMWRTTARGVTTDTKVGLTLNRVIVRKNLMLRLVTPRFLMEGDELSIGVIVQNYLSSAKDTKVSLSATGVELLEGAEKTVNVEAKGSKKVEFRVRVKPGAESVITAKGITNEESDAMEYTIPIKSYGTLFSNGASGALTGKQNAKAVLKAPGAGNRTVEVSVSPSLAGSLFGALDYLTKFPYGCTEQTMSSFLPNVIVSKALDDLHIKSNVNRDELFKKVNAGLDRLYDYQHGDGAWGWWKTDESHPFMTAHVVSGLKQAKEAGYEVSPDAIERGEKWLRGEFKRQSDAVVDLRAYIAYALGGKQDVDVVWEQRSKMSSYGLAFLGLALDRLKDPRALGIAQELEAAAKQNESEAWWPGTRDSLLDFNDDITPEITSYALKLLSHQRPSSPLLPKAASWLVMHKDQGEWWNSTKQTAMVIYGVTDYLKVSGELKPDLKVTVLVNGKEVLAREFQEADAMALKPYVASVAAADSNEVEVKVSGTGRAYWSAQAKYYSPEEGRKPSEGGTMSVKREYYRLLPRENAGVTTYALEPLSGDIHPGDSIAVLLNVTAKDWKYVLIEDPIPAGMELVTNDNTINLAGKPTWWRYSWAQREFRDDRVAFFRTYFFNDTAQYFYVMKAVNPGKFRVSPTRIQPMYQPQQMGTGSAAVLEVKQ